MRGEYWPLRLVIPLLLLPIAVRAITIEPLSIEALTTQADVVLHGTVLAKTCQRDPAGRIFTTVQLRVIDVWKGAISGSPFPIVHGGGTVGEDEAIVSGQVHYEIGEELIAFLVRNQRGEGVTLGLMQGKFQVWQNGQTKYVASPFHGVPHSPGAGPARERASAKALAGPLSLAELKQLVREARR